MEVEERAAPGDAPSSGRVKRPFLVGELLIMVGLLFVYDRVRRIAPVRRATAVEHGVRLLAAEGPYAWERAFNHWLADHRLLGWVSVGYYQFFHIGAAVVVLSWCYIRRPDVYRPARNALVAINVVGLAWYAIYPVAPPRLLPGAGFVDLVARAGYGSSHGPIPMDAYAAMPSLHLAWAVCVALAGLSVARSRPVRVAFVLHPVLTAVFVVGTGNHYVADVVAGTILGFVACFAAGLGWARKPHPVLVSPAARPRFTLVSFHAHPDDEALIAGGTLARAAVDGHRVVVVTATLGEAGLTGAPVDEGSLGNLRLTELEAAADALGCERVEWLGYADSGRFGEVPSPDAFASADVEAAAARLAEVLRGERADALTIYDSAGGYGHPDHVQVHRVGRRAAELAGTPLVLEATVDRRGALRLARILRFVPGLPAEFRPAHVRNAFTRHDRLTHRVDVRPQLGRKRAAMIAHQSQQTGGAGSRSLALYLRVPGPLFRMLFGTEWFVEVGRSPAGPLLDDVFATLHGVPLERRTMSSRHDSAGAEVGFGGGAVSALEPAMSQGHPR